MDEITSMKWDTLTDNGKGEVRELMQQCMAKKTILDSQRCVCSNTAYSTYADVC